MAPESTEQDIDDFAQEQSNEKFILTHSRTHSYDWSEDARYGQQSLLAHASGPSNMSHSGHSHVVEQESMQERWNQQDFGAQAPVHNSPIGFPEYASQSHFYQGQFGGYSGMSEMDPNAYSTTSSSMLSSPVPVKVESYLPFAEANKHDHDMSPNSRTSLTLDNLDDPTRAAILDLVCKGKKQVTLLLD
jgi:hypothetical protein